MVLPVIFGEMHGLIAVQGGKDFYSAKETSMLNTIFVVRLKTCHNNTIYTFSIWFLIDWIVDGVLIWLSLMLWISLPKISPKSVHHV